MPTHSSPQTIRARAHVFALDCPDATALATFYAGLLGWHASDADGDGEWVSVKPSADEYSGFHLAFQRVEHFRAPDWPDGEAPQQAHLDFWVDSIAASEPIALELGATRHAVQPGRDDGWIVFLDPAGHPFCLCETD